MKIMVVSDSHGRVENIRKAYAKVKPVDLFIHLGDVEDDQSEIESFIPCRKEFVRGNCDFFSRNPDDKVIEVCGKKILLTHGHRHGAGYGTEELEEAGRKSGAAIVMYGHTHMPLLTYNEDVILFNPGSISKPRQDGCRPVFGIVEINQKGEVLFNYVYL